MEVQKRLLQDLAARVESALNAEGTLELEARIDPRHEPVTRAAFERLVAYMHAYRKVIEPQSDTLDVASSVYRATLHTVEAISDMCATGAGVDKANQDDVSYMRKEQVVKKLEIPDYDVVVSLSRELPLDARDAVANITKAGANSLYRLKRRVAFLSRDGLFRVDLTAVKQASGPGVSALATAEETYEVEVELLYDTAAALSVPSSEGGSDDEADKGADAGSSDKGASARADAGSSDEGASAKPPRKPKSKSEKRPETSVARRKGGAPSSSGPGRKAFHIASALLSASGELIQVLRESRSIVTRSRRVKVMSDYARMAPPESATGRRWNPPQPVTLEKINLLEETVDSFSVRDDYTVTDKADGRRYLMVIDSEGLVHLVAQSGHVRGTGEDFGPDGAPAPALRIPALANSMLDGELITSSRTGQPMDLYLVFDVYHFRGQDVRGLPLVTDSELEAATEEFYGAVGGRRGSPELEEGGEAEASARSVPSGAKGDAETSPAPGGRMSTRSRLGLVGPGTAARSALDQSANPHIRVKRFLRREAAGDMYAAYTSLGRGGVEYVLDGLILTPSFLGVGQLHRDLPSEKTGDTWERAFKWKPPSENSLDFKVRWDKTSAGAPVIVDGKMRASLLVGARTSTDVDPYALLTGSTGPGGYELRPFRCERFESSDDPTSFVFAPEVSPGGSRGSATPRELPRCAYPPRDVVSDGSIVEFAWRKGSGWVPLRLRSDKDRPNDISVANSVWRSISFPIEIEDIVRPEGVKDAGAGARDENYFNTSATGEQTERMRRFHGYVKGTVALGVAVAIANGGTPGGVPAGTAAAGTEANFDVGKTVSGADASSLRLLDLATGRGGDMYNWMRAGFRQVVGIDLYESAVQLAYGRLADDRRRKNARARQQQQYAFVPLDLRKPVDHEAVNGILNPSMRRIAQSLWLTGTGGVYRPDPKLRQFEGLAARPFDVCSCMFAIHYFFEDRKTLEVFVDNVDRQLRPGGVFVGTCMDGRAVDEAFVGVEPDSDGIVALVGSDGAGGGGIAWKIQKLYEGLAFSKGSTSPPVFGAEIDVFVDNLGFSTKEYLLDFRAFQEVLESRGIRLLTKPEVASFGLRASTEMFSDTFAATDWGQAASGAGGVPTWMVSLARSVATMTDVEKRFSFLNRWFVFVKRSGKPDAPAATDGAPKARKETKGAKAAKKKAASKKN